MSILGRLVAILLISFMALAPRLAGATSLSQPNCDMAGMHQDSGGADTTSKALAAICKVQCQVSVVLPQPDLMARTMSLSSQFQQVERPNLPSRSNPPEAPPPRS